jgi:hypothetical protein
MERNEPDPPELEPEPAQPVGATEQALRRLEQRLDAASTAAERLIADAARSVARGREAAGGETTESAKPPDPTPPPAGWQTPEPGVAGRPNADVETLLQVVRSLRELIPPELQRRLAEALREVLLALRALIDWYLERLEHARREPVEVQDIPIS